MTAVADVVFTRCFMPPLLYPTYVVAFALAFTVLASRPVAAQAPPAAPSDALAAPTAEPPTQADEDAGTQPVPPQVKQSAEPVFPKDAKKAGVTQASVTLKVQVEADGKVTKADVVASAGASFDDAALEAASQYVFAPALVGGSPVASIILLRIDFQAPVENATGESVPGDAAKAPTESAPTESSPSETAPSDTAPGETAFAASEPSEVPSGGPAPTPNEAVGKPLADQSNAEPASATQEPVEVTVVGESAADRLRRSAEAVQVLETQEAKRHTQDLGEVLARTQGVGVQRSSGLGSDTRVSLNGLIDDQIRFFLDGIPLDFTSYPFGIANVPVNLIQRVEVYRGVVPVRFGADALGGAINLVSEQGLKAGAHGAASFQAGSFGTYRSTVSGHYLNEDSGLLARVAAFHDSADNNYPMTVLVPDASGQEVETRVYRFHDAYRALGANAELGVQNRPWAKRLTLQAFASDYDKEVQHNLLMTFNPYGDVVYGQFTAGGTVRYEQVFAQRIATEIVAGYSYRQLEYSDLGECHYNWFAQCFRTRQQPGERIGRAQEQDYWDHNAFARVNVEWRPGPMHALRLSLSPNYTTRGGKEHRLANPEARDPLSAQRQIGSLVSGLEYRTDALEDALENRLFIKDYVQFLRSEDPLSNGVDFRREDRTTHRLGFGDGARYSLLEWLYVKASYEWSTRLPRPDEVFGNAFPIQPNLALKPEVSHNVNLGLTVESVTTMAGTWRADVNGFVRDVRDLIRVVGNDESASYRNVRDARSLGIETALGWTSLGEYVALDGNATYVDFRNTSTDGADADYKGDRIPNRPYFFTTGNARFQLRGVTAPRDELSLTWTSRYVHSFFRGWESIGVDKPIVPAQLLHSIALTFFNQGDVRDLSFSGELQNLTDAEAYDYFGVPKPGRAFYFKMTASL